MPVLKHASKKLRQDKKRAEANKKIKDAFKDLVKEARLAKTPDALNKAFSSIDKATKKHIMHKNKAARMKASLSKLLLAKTAAKPSPVTPKRTTKKKSSSKAKKS